MNWRLWSRQVQAVARLEVKKYMRGRKWLGVYVLAFAPVFLMLVVAASGTRLNDELTTSQLELVVTNQYAELFQAYLLRFGIFISCGVVFSQLVRGEILEKTLHYYLMAPARREILALGKYVAGVGLTFTLFAVSTVATHLLIYYPLPTLSAFFLDGPGLGHLIQYLSVVLFACMSYGALSLIVGILFPNPGPPMMLLLGWESLNFLLPASLQQLSIIHYLQALLPVAISRGPFALVAEPTPAFIGLPLLVMVIALAVTGSGLLLRRAQITYSAD